MGGLGRFCVWFAGAWLLVAGGLVATPESVSAATCTTWGAPPPQNHGADISDLAAVDVVDSCTAWAVGFYQDAGVYRTYIQRWNGSGWVVQSSPSGSAGDSYLNGVSAVSAKSAWAVGVSSGRTLILHWNGSAWKRQLSPHPGVSSALYAVVATSPTNAWAVGSYYDGSATKTLILRWNGSSWTRQKSPNQMSPTNELQGVTATSASAAWAVGFANGGTPLVMRWNGSAWRLQKTVAPGGLNSELAGVSAISPTNVWAVGTVLGGTAARTLILHWNGSSWKRKASPNVGTEDNFLTGVAATSASNAWAVGFLDERCRA